MWGAMKPLANIKRTKVSRCYLIGLSTGELKRKKERKQKRYKKVGVILLQPQTVLIVI